MTADEPEKLAKIVVDLPNHWAAAGEGLWARDLGDGSYEIRNIPFHAYGLNLGDIVEASAERPDLKPVVRRVVRSGGHRTLRVRFEKTVPEQTRLMLLRKRNRHKASFERGTDTYFAIDIEPDGDYDAVCKHWKSGSRRICSPTRRASRDLRGASTKGPPDGPRVFTGRRRFRSDPEQECGVRRGRYLAHSWRSISLI